MRSFAFGEVTVTDMMAARERRAERQRTLLLSGRPLICLTMNIPGPVKVTPRVAVAFAEGKRLIEAAFPNARFCGEIAEKTGLEAYYSADGDAADIKRTLCATEDETPLGRLFDIDVLRTDGEKISREALGLPPRTCFLCGRPAFVCARSRAHSIGDMTDEINRRITVFYRERTVSRLSAAAVSALIEEARTTPKPGLVDERSIGSHPDMSLSLLIQSARALENYFTECASLGFDNAPAQVFPLLQKAGIRAEHTMLAATGNINTHKGAIFSLGLLCAAQAHHAAVFDMSPETVCQTAGCIARPATEQYFAALTSPRTFGERLYAEKGVRGIRGEAADGFPSLLAVLPAFSAECRVMPRMEAGVRALIRLMSRIQDTTLVKRGGEKAAEHVRTEARRIESAGFPQRDILALDDAMIAENLTCGGCADLLACLYFLTAVPAWNE